jgi:hypothetical protein
MDILQLLSSGEFGRLKNVKNQDKLQRLWSTTPGVEYLLDPFVHLDSIYEFVSGWNGWSMVDSIVADESLFHEYLEKVPEDSQITLANLVLLGLYLRNDQIQSPIQKIMMQVLIVDVDVCRKRILGASV